MKKHDLIGGIQVGNTPCSVMPGAGIVKTPEDLEKLLKNDDIQIIEMGAITVPERMPNPGNILYFDERNRFSVNSVGMSNLGMEKYKTVLTQMVAIAHKRRKKLIVNVAAVQDSKEYIVLYDLCTLCKVDGVVFNFGCPNLWANGKQHPPLSLNPEGLEGILKLTSMELESAHEFLHPGLSFPPIWVKLSPLVLDHSVMRTLKANEPLPSFELDTKLIEEVASVLKRHSSLVKAVVCTNTIGQVRVESEAGHAVLGPNPNNPNATGGLAGRIIHSVSVAQAQAFSHALRNTNIDIIGAGGVTSGEEAYDFIKAGCSLVQIVSEYHRTQNAGIFSEIASDIALAAAAHVGQI